MTRMDLILLVLAALWAPRETRSVKPEPRLDRSYQLTPIHLINGVQGVQYVPMTAVYSEIPTLLVPKQIDMMALHSTPASNVALPPQGIAHQKYYENVYSGGEEYRPIQEPVLQPIRSSPYRKTKVPMYTMKRPSYYNFGRKKFGANSAYQNQKASSVSIEPSIDISDQLQHLQSSYPSTTPSPASTYGPAKVLDHQQNGHTHVTTYIRPKGHHPHYRPKDYRVYSHSHKGHIHNHYVPSGYSLHKSQYHSSAKPLYSILKPTMATYAPAYQPEPTINYNTYVRPDTFSTNHVVFPDGELKKSLLNAYKAHQEEILSSTRFGQSLKTHSDLTQAIVKDSGTITNYDASVPVKIPSKKPNKFEVKEILRNADVHFIDGTLSEPIEYQQHQFVQYSPFREFDPSKSAFLAHGVAQKDNALISGFSQGINNNHIDYYDQRDASGFPHGHSVSDELSTSETVKVPVAVIKGTHVGSSHPLKQQRSEQSEKGKHKAFTPSRTSSDWIPMSGKALAQPSALSSSSSSSSSSSLSSSSLSASSSDISESRYGEKYYADILGTRTEEPPRIITSNRNIGDIISGKIPMEYSPFKKSVARPADAGGDIITGKIPFEGGSEIDRRKGSVLTVDPSSSDTSNLVVSSMIKFS